MEILKCASCGRTQREGKFCLDCGHNLEKVITSEVSFKPIKTGRTSEALKRDVRRWLNRIGVQNPDIKINTSDRAAEIEYNLGKGFYHFKSTLQANITDNLAAVEQFLHYRVLGIERGIETTEQAFAGYEALPFYEDSLRSMSDEELRRELKNQHPDTGTGNREDFDKLMAEKNRRKQHSRTS